MWVSMASILYGGSFTSSKKRIAPRSDGK